MSGLKDILLNVGAVAGFAALLGLAVLAMLYFSQARDVRRLREWAGREPERAAEVELRAQQIASAAIAQAYESMAMRQSEAAAAAQIAEDAGVDISAMPPPTVAQPPAAPPPAATTAGEETGPGVSEETQAHDVVAHEFGGEQVPPLEPPYEVAAAANPAAEASTQTPDADALESGDLGTGDAAGAATSDAPEPPSAEPPSTEPPSAEPVVGAAAETNVLRPSTPAAARSSVPLPPLPPLDTSEFQAVHRPTTPPIPDYYLTSTTGSGHFDPIDPPSDHRSRVPFAVAGVLVAVFAVILIATQLLGGNETTTTKGTGGSPNNRPQVSTSKDRNQRINRAAVTVSVLNGTDTAGIAATAAAGLNKAGFTDTTTGNLSDGTVHPTSTVYYASGSKPEAEEVAKELGITDIQPATDAVIARGGSVPVIVVLGANFQQ